jgi:hypothetical protein
VQQAAAQCEPAVRAALTLASPAVLPPPRPAPAPTEEATQGLEELIKKRVAEGKFDDVVRVVPPPAERTRRQIELDDSQAQQVGVWPADEAPVPATCVSYQLALDVSC